VLAEFSSNLTDRPRVSQSVSQSRVAVAEAGTFREPRGRGTSPVGRRDQATAVNT
jgi:hypothetical protein